MIWLLVGLVLGVSLAVVVQSRPPIRNDPVVQERLRRYCQM